jgi:hypothetical protein
MKYFELPTTCPECGGPFSKLLPPEPKRQFATYLVSFPGAAISFVLIMGIPWLIPHPPFLVFEVAMTVAFGPALFCAWIAMRMPKVVTVRCHVCKWSKKFLVR